MRPDRRFLLTGAVFSALAITFAATASLAPARDAVAPIFTGIVKDTAVGGYDPVAYFKDGKPVAGSKDITLQHGGATWRFASEANRAAFAADPQRYEPRYGGYCAWAVSQGYTAKGDPKAWKIVGGKLYLNYDQNVQRTWEKDSPGHISRADANWPKIVGKPGT